MNAIRLSPEQKANITRRVAERIDQPDKFWHIILLISIWKDNCRTTAKEKKPSYSSHLTRPFETAALISEPPFLCACTNQWRLAGTRQPMGGYFAVSTLLFYFSCDLHKLKKARTRHRGIPGIGMNTEIMWIDFILLLRLSAFCRQALFVVIGDVSTVPALRPLPDPATHPIRTKGAHKWATEKIILIFPGRAGQNSLPQNE